MVVRIAVIGAGVIGLSSALAVQERLPEARVEILADKFYHHTTSDGSGGLFVPEAENIPETLSDRWAKDGAKHFFELAASSEGGESGVNFVTGFELRLSEELPAWSKYMINFQDIPNEFKKQFAKFYKHCYMFTTVIIEGRKYLPWLTNRFLSNGGHITEKTVKSFDELCGDFDLIINCAGLRGGELASDPIKVHPWRGHIVRVSAPWIKHFVHSDDNHYYLPSSDHAAVGGTRQLGRSDLVPEPRESQRILREMKERFPPLEGAKVLWEWVGLRPYRDPVRVEAEVVTCKGKQLKVVHNYGHGAYGMSLSWGTGLYTADLAQRALLYSGQAKL